MADRKPRQAEERAATERKKSWSRQSILPVPEPRDGLCFRWIRTSLVGNSDNPNVSRKFREGWRPSPKSEHTDLQVFPDIDSRWPDNIEVGGLLLCQAPAEMVEDHRAALKEQTENQIRSVDNNYLRQNDPRMPMLKPERTTRTTFGD